MIAKSPDTPSKPTPKQRMLIERQHMPEQDAQARAANFGEVNLGLTEQLALLEADRCLQCKVPKCVNGCPVKVNIPQFIKHLSEGDLPGAAKCLLRDNVLLSITPDRFYPVGIGMFAGSQGFVRGYRVSGTLRRRLGAGAFRRSNSE